MKKLLPLLLMVVLLVGCENEDPETPNDIVGISTKGVPWINWYWYDRPLTDANVPHELREECMRWAFGDDYFSIQQRYFSDRWNEKHSDLFVMYGSDDRNDAIYKVGKAYLKWIKKNERSSKRP